MAFLLGMMICVVQSTVNMCVSPFCDAWAAADQERSPNGTTRVASDGSSSQTCSTPQIHARRGQPDQKISFLCVLWSNVLCPFGPEITPATDILLEVSKQLNQPLLHKQIAIGLSLSLPKVGSHHKKTCMCSQQQPGQLRRGLADQHAHWLKPLARQASQDPRHTSFSGA